MTDKIKIVAYSRQPRRTSSENIYRIPLFIAQELDGEYEEVNYHYLNFLWHIMRHSSSIEVLVLDNLSGPLNRLGRWYRWLNPMGKLVTIDSIAEHLHHEKSFSTAWAEKNYRLWVNQVLLPQIGFTPLAEAWEY